MGALALVQSADFGSVTVDLYRDDHEIWMTSEQVGKALGYAYPVQSIQKLFERNQARLEPKSAVVKLTSTDGKAYETRVFSEEGIYEILRKSNQPKADEFYDWVYRLLHNLRTGTLTVTPTATPGGIDAETARRLGEAQLLNAKTRQARELRLMMQASRDWLPEGTLRQMAQDAARLLAPEGVAPEPPSRPRTAPPETPSLVARNIRFWRVERRLAIRDLCARIRVDYTRLAEWETGKRTIPAPMVGIIAQALHVDPQRFFEEPPPKHGGEIDR